MPIVIIQDFPEEETERSTANYDAISRRLQDSGAIPPEGCHLHCTGWTGHGFQIIEIWDSREQFDRFLADHVMPLVMEMEGANQQAPEITSYELHSLMTP
jgi:hypothetical protein